MLAVDIQSDFTLSTRWNVSRLPPGKYDTVLEWVGQSLGHLGHPTSQAAFEGGKWGDRPRLRS
jgi:hypothetical protein